MFWQKKFVSIVLFLFSFILWCINVQLICTSQIKFKRFYKYKKFVNNNRLNKNIIVIVFLFKTALEWNRVIQRTTLYSKVSFSPLKSVRFWLYLRLENHVTSDGRDNKTIVPNTLIIIYRFSNSIIINFVLKLHYVHLMVKSNFVLEMFKLISN